MTELSPRMRKALAALKSGPVSPWQFGWGTYKALLRRGLIVRVAGQDWSHTTQLTEKGRAAVKARPWERKVSASPNDQATVKAMTALALRVGVLESAIAQVIQNDNVMASEDVQILRDALADKSHCESSSEGKP